MPPQAPDLLPGVPLPDIPFAPFLTQLLTDIGNIISYLAAVPAVGLLLISIFFLMESRSSGGSAEGGKPGGKSASTSSSSSTLVEFGFIALALFGVVVAINTLTGSALSQAIPELPSGQAIPTFGPPVNWEKLPPIRAIESSP